MSTVILDVRMKRSDHSTVSRRGQPNAGLSGRAAEAETPPLLLPWKRPVPQQLSQPEPLRLPPVEDRLDTDKSELRTPRVDPDILA
jgi:hypothetical protein